MARSEIIDPVDGGCSNYVSLEDGVGSPIL
jgi:hypothetical protein